MKMETERKVFRYVRRFVSFHLYIYYMLYSSAYMHFMKCLFRDSRSMFPIVSLHFRIKL